MREKTTAKLHFRLTDEEIAEFKPYLEHLTRCTCTPTVTGAVMANCEALYAIAWICEAYEKRRAEIEAGSDDEAFQRSIAFIYENCSRHITISEFSEIARMSRTAYNNKFKRVTGTTPSKFQTQYRVELAKNLLTETAMSIYRIAVEVGCFDASHLVRIFSAETGVTPSEYRNKRN